MGMPTIAREIIDNRFSALVFDFYTADTFEPHPDAAYPSMTLNCETSLNLAPPGLDPGGDISEYDPAVMDSCGDNVFFVVSHFNPMEDLTPSGRRRDELFYCICWREGLLVPVCYSTIAAADILADAMVSFAWNRPTKASPAWTSLVKVRFLCPARTNIAWRYAHFRSARYATVYYIQRYICSYRLWHRS